MQPANYQQLHDSLLKSLASERIITEPLRLLAYGTDASFYRLIPKMVVQVHSEVEAQEVIRLTHTLKIPLTFRAAGTSLSGQAISDSVLMIATHHWRGHKILDDGLKITLQPGVIGAKANVLLAPYGRKIGPDPASINAAMIGGIASNNASGMCCGTAQNSYKTVADIRIILHDGTILDTSSEESKKLFRQTHVEFLQEIQQIYNDIKNDEKLSERIKTKYKIKNTTGYSLNALVDYNDPFEIIKHLMIGAEGTLAFISDITYHTVVDEKYKSCALMIFNSVEDACRATALIKNSPVSAVELLDRKSIRSVEDSPQAPEYFKELSETICVLLVECQDNSPEALREKEQKVRNAVASIATVHNYEFTSNPKEYDFNWRARKGLLASVGGMRETGSTCLIEDVAFPIEHLAEACLAIQDLFQKYGYEDAVLFGHALEGNLHIVFSQRFNDPIEVQRYADVMDGLADIVVNQFDGSLKAEHGTGRNMAPYVEKEWGEAAYIIMKRIKTLFDPESLINPGVIINQNPVVHLENLKPLPPAHELIDQCMECGFCEPSCVSEGLTLSPRQRIVISREISRLKASGESVEQLRHFEKEADYCVLQTCAGDGLCKTTCPVNIDTGAYVKVIKANNISKTTRKVGNTIGKHMAGTTALVRTGLFTVHGIRSVIGDSIMQTCATAVRKVSGNRVPLWTPYLPKSAAKINYRVANPGFSEKVVYFPSCVTRSMGTAKQDPVKQQDLVSHTERLLKRAGYTIHYPVKINSLCCGMAFRSKGLPEIGEQKQQELEQALWQASEDGKYPVLLDTSPCYESLIKHLQLKGVKIYDPISFMLEHVIQRLPVKHKKKHITIFPVCSVKNVGKEAQLIALARFCADEVDIVKSNCCGFAGDKGLSLPELNLHGLRHLTEQISVESEGAYSTSRTCEIGLSHKSGIPFKSIFYLIDEVTKDH